jgi:hypothetical protein
MLDRGTNLLHHQVTIGYVGRVVHLYEKCYAIPSSI